MDLSEHHPMVVYVNRFYFNGPYLDSLICPRPSMATQLPGKDWRNNVFIGMLLDTPLLIHVFKLTVHYAWDIAKEPTPERAGIPGNYGNKRTYPCGNS